MPIARRAVHAAARRGNVLIQVIRNDRHYDYVKDFMLDLLIASREVVQFKRSSGWVTVGIDPIRRHKREKT
jgi:hypothetical protein